MHYEHQNNVTQLKTETETSLKAQNDEQREKEYNMKKASKKAKAESKEQDLSHEDVMKNLKQVYPVSVQGCNMIIRNMIKASQSYDKNLKEGKKTLIRNMKEK